MDDQNTNSNSGSYSIKEKRVFYSAVARAILMGIALMATIWVIGKLNSGTLFTGGGTTATLFGISAGRGQ